MILNLHLLKNLSKFLNSNVMIRTLFQILFNALILYLITYLLWANSESNIQSGVILWCIDCSYNSIQAWKTYLIGGIILWLLNAFVKPVMKILTLPLYFVLMWAVSLLINASVLILLGFLINDILAIQGVAYEIDGMINLIIAVAIFTFLNTVYSILFSK